MSRRRRRSARVPTTSPPRSTSPRRARCSVNPSPRTPTRDRARPRSSAADVTVPGIPVIALVNLLFGIGFALIARDRLRADGPFAAPAFPLITMHAAAVVAPVALYFYAVHPAWSWMYWIDPHKLTGLAVLPLMVGHAGLVIGGWYVAALLLRRGFINAVLYVGAAIALALLVLVVATINRLGTATDFYGWQVHRGKSLFEVQLGWS